MAVSKAQLRKEIRDQLNKQLSALGGSHTDEAGMALWTIKAPGGMYFGYAVQLDKYPLTEKGGGRFTIRYYASKSPRVLEWTKSDVYYPGRSFLSRLASSYKLGGDWIKFENPNDLTVKLGEHAGASVQNFRTFMSRNS
jgi:hypothetical protein